jgi:hypothetical protein
MANPTSANIPVQLRAGRNIGIEKGLTPFVQAGASRETEINPTIGSSTVILLCPDKTARAIQTDVTPTSGLSINTTVATINYLILFQDTQGNKAFIGAGIASPGVANFLYGTEADASTVVLAPGEAIVIEIVTPK